MTKAMKIVGYTLITIVGLLIVAAVALPHLINPNDHKAEIVKLVHDATGRQLTIGGDIRLSVFPWLGVEVNDLSLSNAPGFDTAPFASVKEADVSVKIIPLILHRDLQVSRVRLKGLSVHLARNAKGVFNWSDLVKNNAGSAARQGGSRSGGGAPLAALTLGGVQVDDAAFTWNDAKTKAHYGLQHVNLTIGAVNMGEPFPVKLAFDVTSNSPPAHGHVNLSANITADLAKDNYRVQDLKTNFDVAEGSPAVRVEGSLYTAITAQPSSGRYQLAAGQLRLTPSGKGFPMKVGQLQMSWQPIDADLTAQTAKLPSISITGLAEGTKLAASGSASHLLGKASFDGNIQLINASPRYLLKVLQIPVTTADPHALSHLAVSAKVVGGTDAVALSNLDVHLDDTHLTGSLNVNHFAKPVVGFDLTVDQIDADRYLPPAAQRKAPGHPQSGAMDAIALPFGLLANLDVNGTLRIRKMRAFSIRSTNDEVVLHIAGRKLRAHPLKAELYGGTYSGDVNVDASGKVPTLSMNETVSHVGVGRLVEDISGIKRLSGTGDVHVKLSGSGATIDAIRRTLSGNVSFSLKDGAIEGVNVWAAIRTARALFKGETPPADTGPNRTEFTELSGTGKVSNGVLDNRDLSLKLPFLRVTGAGQVNLIKQTIDYKTTAKVIGTPNFSKSENLSDLRGLDIPLMIGGTFTKPTVKPDLAMVLREQIKRKAQGRLKQAEEKAKGKLDNALKKLFGGGN